MFVDRHCSIDRVVLHCLRVPFTYCKNLVILCSFQNNPLLVFTLLSDWSVIQDDYTLNEAFFSVLLLCLWFQVFHLEDIVEETGYVLEQDSEYCQRFLEDEEEVSVSITQKGGKALQYQVWLCLLLSITS